MFFRVELLLESHWQECNSLQVKQKIYKQSSNAPSFKFWRTLRNLTFSHVQLREKANCETSSFMSMKIAYARSKTLEIYLLSATWAAYVDLYGN